MSFEIRDPIHGFESEEDRRSVPLSSLSSLVKGLSPVFQQRIYVPIEERARAQEIIDRIIKEVEA